MKQKQFPYIVLPLSDGEIDKKLDYLNSKGIDGIELRVDMFHSTEINHIKDLVYKIKNKNLFTILTVRSINEGGVNKIEDDYRIKIFKELSGITDYLDIELSSREIIEKVIKFAKDKGTQVIVSYHDFEKTPTKEEIQSIIDKSFEYGADISKYAFKVNTVDDVGKIMTVSFNNKEIGRKIIAIGMGELGKITRVAGYFFGSVMTYTFIGKAVAPGQIDLDTLKKELQFYKVKDL